MKENFLIMDKNIGQDQILRDEHINTGQDQILRDEHINWFIYYKLKYYH
jgi:hypothetical protein